MLNIKTNHFIFYSVQQTIVGTQVFLYANFFVVTFFSLFRRQFNDNDNYFVVIFCFLNYTNERRKKVASLQTPNIVANVNSNNRFAFYVCERAFVCKCIVILKCITFAKGVGYNGKQFLRIVCVYQQSNELY